MGGTRNLRKNWDCLDHFSAKIGKNTWKSPGDLLLLRLQWNPPIITGVKKSQKHNNNNNNDILINCFWPHTDATAYTSGWLWTNLIIFVNIYFLCLYLYFFSSSYEPLSWRSPLGVVVNILDCDIVVCDFEFQSCYCVHFQSIYQPLRSGRIWHKVNFLSGV